MNGESDQSERTPLLQRSPAARVQVLPALLPLASRLRDPHSAAIEETVQSCTLPSPAAATALTLLLCLKCILSSRLRLDVFPSYQHVHLPISVDDLEDIENLAKSTWETSASQASEREIDEILWMRFPMRDVGSNSKSITVMEFVMDWGSPRYLTMHPQITRSLLDNWRFGNSPYSPEADATVINVWDRVDSVAAPRVLHGLELIIFMAHLALLTHCILQPPSQSTIAGRQRLDWRAVVLEISSTSFITRRPSIRRAPFLLTLLAFFSAFPSSPDPNDSAYALLLVCLSFHIFQLHLPLAPTPVLLSPLSKALPLSSLLQTIASQIITPAFVFFLPALMVLSVLLSISLSGPFFWGSFLNFTEPGPANARVALLVLLFAVSILFFCLVVSLVLIFPTMGPPADHMIAWDNYTPQLGFQVRRALLAATVEYASPYFFPAPFNVLYIILVSLPTGALRLLGRRDQANSMKNASERLLWRTTVLPFSMAIGALWAWGLLGKRSPRR